jgi:hypothetical protein
MSSLTKKYYYLPLIILCGFYIFKSYYFEIHDFANYYFGAQFLKEEIFNNNIYFPYYFNKNIADLGFGNVFLSYAPNTPFLSILFLPFTFLEIGISKLVFNSISSLLFLFSLIRLSKHLKIKKEYLLLIPILFFIPIKNNLLFGQLYFLLFFLLSEGLLAYQKQRYKTVAIFWSFAIFLKVFPIVLALFLITRKKYKALIYLTTFCFILLLFSVSINGIEVWKFYFLKVLSRANNGEIAGAFVDNYQSIFMFLKRLFIYDEIYNKTAILNSPSTFNALLIFIKLTIIGVGIYITKKRGDTIIAFAFWLLISVLISPYGSTYNYILLIFLYLGITKLHISKTKKYSLLLILFIISNNTFLSNLIFPINYIRLFSSIILLISISLYFRDIINFKKLLGFVAILTITLLLFSKTKTNYKSIIEVPILTYNYQINNNKIIYSYWNQNGENHKKVDFKYSTIDSVNVTIIDNQIFYKNEQITFDNSNKMNVRIINNKELVFLSDANRGIGFYDLKKININE